MESNQHVGRSCSTGRLAEAGLDSIGSMTKKLIVGNWKMNGSLAANAELLGRGAGRTGWLPDRRPRSRSAPVTVSAQLRGRWQGSALDWGAVDCSTHEGGRLHRRVSAPMLQEFGCRYVIVGHSSAASTTASRRPGRDQGAAGAAGHHPIVLCRRDAGRRERQAHRLRGQAPARR